MSVLAMEPARQQAAQQELPPSMVERMTLILDRFGSREEHLTLDQVARTTGLPRSTAHRILDQLVRLEWLDHSPLGYRLGRRACLLGGGVVNHEPLREAASPHLLDLLLRTGAVVHLAVLDGSRVRYLDKLGGRFATAVPSRVGGTAPAHCTALGKSMLAWLPAEEVDEIVGQPSPRTSASIGRLDSLHAELTRIRARGGLAQERGEFDPSIACVAAAIRAPRGPVGAVSVVAGAGSAVEKVGPLVLDVARRISADLASVTD